MANPISTPIRAYLKSQGIKARVMIMPGHRAVSVVTPTYEARFTAEDIHAFCAFAKSQGMTGVRGTPIDPDHEARLTEKQQWNFHL